VEGKECGRLASESRSIILMADFLSLFSCQKRAKCGKMCAKFFQLIIILLALPCAFFALKASMREVFHDGRKTRHDCLS